MNIVKAIRTENTRKSIPRLQPLIYSKQAQSIAKAMPRIIHLLRKAKQLERVVLWRDLLLEETAQRSPHHDVVANLGDLGEEEEGEESGNAAKAGSQGAAALSEYVLGGRWGVDCDILLDEVVGGNAVEVGLDGVPAVDVRRLIIHMSNSQQLSPSCNLQSSLQLS